MRTRCEREGETERERGRQKELRCEQAVSCCWENLAEIVPLSLQRRTFKGKKRPLNKETFYMGRGRCLSQATATHPRRVRESLLKILFSLHLPLPPDPQEKGRRSKVAHTQASSRYYNQRELAWRGRCGGRPGTCPRSLGWGQATAAKSGDPRMQGGPGPGSLSWSLLLVALLRITLICRLWGLFQFLFLQLLLLAFAAGELIFVLFFSTSSSGSGTRF